MPNQGQSRGSRGAFNNNNINIHGLIHPARLLYTNDIAKALSSDSMAGSIRQVLNFFLDHLLRSASLESLALDLGLDTDSVMEQVWHIFSKKVATEKYACLVKGISLHDLSRHSMSAKDVLGMLSSQNFDSSFESTTESRSQTQQIIRSDESKAVLAYINGTSFLKGYHYNVSFFFIF
jgi:hypothetical protein